MTSTTDATPTPQDRARALKLYGLLAHWDELTEQAFEEFYQLEDTDQERHGGLGLGLSIVQRLQALLGLDLKMESSEGAGTRFYMWVPKTHG